MSNSKKLYVDPDRLTVAHKEECYNTGIYVMAYLPKEGTRMPADISTLTKQSLRDWLEASGPVCAINCVGIFLGHDHLYTTEEAEKILQRQKDEDAHRTNLALRTGMLVGAIMGLKDTLDRGEDTADGIRALAGLAKETYLAVRYPDPDPGLDPEETGK